MQTAALCAVDVNRKGKRIGGNLSKTTLNSSSAIFSAMIRIHEFYQVALRDSASKYGFAISRRRWGIARECVICPEITYIGHGVADT